MRPVPRKLLVFQAIVLVLAGIGVYLFTRPGEEDALRETATRFAERLAASEFEAAVEEFTLARDRERIGLEIDAVRRQVRERFTGSDPIPEEERSRIVDPPKGRDLIADLRWLETEVRLQRELPENLPILQILLEFDGPELEEDALESTEGRRQARDLATLFLARHLETTCLGIDLPRLQFGEIVLIEPDLPEGADGQTEQESAYLRALVRLEDGIRNQTLPFHQRRLHYGDDPTWYVDLTRWYGSKAKPGKD